jgi:serine/threonine protein kinase
MLAGHPPFPGLSAPKLLIAHMIETPESVTTHRAGAPPQLAHVLMRCLEKDPANRWQSVDELLPLLEELVVSLGARAAPKDANERSLDAAAMSGVASVSEMQRAGLEAFERGQWREAFTALSAADTTRRCCLVDWKERRVH